MDNDLALDVAGCIPLLRKGCCVKPVYRALSAMLAGAVSGPAAMAVTPLQSVVTANPSEATSSILTTSVAGAGQTRTVNGNLSVGDVSAAQFDTATGILVGATVTVNTAVAAIAQVTGTVNPSGNGRTITSTASFAGAISAPGVTFGSTQLVASRVCSGGNCPNSPGNQSASTAGSIVGTSAVAQADLASYAGSGSVMFNRSATGSTTVTNGSGGLNGTANGLFSFGSATPASNVYRIAYDYVNFASPSFNGSSVVTDTSLNFGNLLLGSGPVTLAFSLFNIGNANSAGLSLTSTGRSTNEAGFTTGVSTFTNGLDGGSSRNYSVTLTPTRLGIFADKFTLFLSDYALGGFGRRNYQLTLNATGNVIAGPSFVPEPATWTLMIAGFGCVGIAARRNVKVVAA